jgi:hypothetical protein
VAASAEPGDTVAAEVLLDAGRTIGSTAPLVSADYHRRALGLLPWDSPRRPEAMALQARALHVGARPPGGRRGGARRAAGSTLRRRPPRHSGVGCQRPLPRRATGGRPRGHRGRARARRVAVSPAGDADQPAAPDRPVRRGERGVRRRSRQPRWRGRHAGGGADGPRPPGAVRQPRE